MDDNKNRSLEDSGLKAQYSKFIVERIQQLRAQLGISERVFSERIGMSHTYISDLAKGTHNPSLGTLLDICIAFDISPQIFFDHDVDYPVAAKQILGELQRLFGSEFEKLPDILKGMNKDDIKSFKKLSKLFGNL